MKQLFAASKSVQCVRSAKRLESRDGNLMTITTLWLKRGVELMLSGEQILKLIFPRIDDKLHPHLSANVESELLASVRRFAEGTPCEETTIKGDTISTETEIGDSFLSKRMSISCFARGKATDSVREGVEQILSVGTPTGTWHNKVVLFGMVVYKNVKVLNDVTPSWAPPRPAVPPRKIPLTPLCVSSWLPCLSLSLPRFFVCFFTDQTFGESDA